MFGILRWRWLRMAVLGALLLPASTGWAANDRKVVNKVSPNYPELARQMNLAGTVKMEIVVAADGTVKAMKALGGHPLLIQSAREALRKWRYAPGPETTTIVEFHFHND